MLVGILALYPLHLVVVNAALDLRPLRSWLNGQQEIVHVKYAHAWSLRPFSVHVEDLEMWSVRGRSTRSYVD